MPEIFRALRALWFKLDPEVSQAMALSILGGAGRIHPFDQYLAEAFRGRLPVCPVRVMGIDFPNPVGLAAGLDKNARAVDGLSALGFGFLELGTVTPLPQFDKARKRLFRLKSREALINRMGFNNVGLNNFLRNFSHRHHQTRVGISIGKNLETPIEQAATDYLTCLRAVYGVTDYVAIDISSPNSTGLFDLQSKHLLGPFLQILREDQLRLADLHGIYTPLAIKISPDLEQQDIERIAHTLMAHELDAVIATNSSQARPEIADNLLAKELGGLSGRPLMELSTEVVREFNKYLRGSIPIIGCGGIFSADDAWAKFCAGASLVQIYTGFAYQGSALVQNIVTDLANRAKNSGTGELAAVLAALHARIANPVSS